MQDVPAVGSAAGQRDSVREQGFGVDVGIGQGRKQWCVGSAGNSNSGQQSSLGTGQARENLTPQVANHAWTTGGGGKLRERRPSSRLLKQLHRDAATSSKLLQFPPIEGKVSLRQSQPDPQHRTRCDRQ